MGEDAQATTAGPESSPQADDLTPGPPSKGKLAALSLCAFTGLLVIGGAIGFFVGPGESAARIDTALAPLPTTSVAPLSFAEPDPEPIAEVVEAAPTTAPATPPNPTAERDDPTPVEPTTAVLAETVSTADVEVLGVTELGLDLGSATTVSTVLPNADVDFVELPKAVYDRFDLTLRETLVINIAANDKLGGLFDAVRETGLGSLPPGFTLESSGVLSGVARECGNWRAQYELISDNPAVGTSWIDITVGGCQPSE